MEKPALITFVAQKIDPYNVAGEVDDTGNVKAIDYDRLIEESGVQPLS